MFSMWHHQKQRQHQPEGQSMMRSRFLFLVIMIISSIASSSDVDPAEPLFRQALAAYRKKSRSRKNDLSLWDPWYELTTSLLKLRDSHPLEAIGGFEESILVIEQATVAAGEGQDPQRDAALSQLYHGYAQLLYSLNADQCTTLSLSPHNLLIGSETAQRESPSTKLCVENAENSLRNAAALDATNIAAEELLSIILGGEGGAHERKPKEFVAELFDSFAETFDEKLGSLGYKVPGLVGAAAKAFLEQKGGKTAPLFNSALDAGCGTGLAGPYLRSLVTGPLVGVDASKKMLDLASECTTSSGCGQPPQKEDGSADNTSEQSLYDGLLELDLEDMTLDNTLNTVLSKHRSSEKPKFELITAADVLVYFGQLDSLIETFAKLSSPNAGLIFSCERATEAEAPLGWRLLSSGRFAHTKRHAVEAASKVGYKLVTYQEIIPRMERGEEVQGHLFTFVFQGKEKTTNEL